MARPLSRRVVTAAAWITIVAAGALTGFVSAHLMTTSPPAIEAVAVDTDTPPPSSLDLTWPGVYRWHCHVVERGKLGECGVTTPMPSYKGHRYLVEIINHCV